MPPVNLPAQPQKAFSWELCELPRRGESVCLCAPLLSRPCSLAPFETVRESREAFSLPLLFALPCGAGMTDLTPRRRIA